MGVRFVILAAIICGACSLALDWDYNHLPCALSGTPPTYACMAGYSCDQNTFCIADHSVGDGDACSLDQQCNSTSLCTQSFIDRPCTGDASCQVCAKTCSLSSEAFTHGTCHSGDYCAPFCTITSTGPSTCSPANRVGACVRGAQCSANNMCTGSASSAPFVCTDLGNSVNACLQACTFTWTFGYDDGCGGSNSYVCTPVGATGQQQMACIALGTTPTISPNATNCDAINHPCTPGYACINNTCSQLCNTAGTSCSGTQHCSAIPGLGPAPAGINRSTLGYCH